MVFSSLFFLFNFLPLVLFLYYIIPNKLRNLYLLLVSLFFYAWGEGFYVFLMLLSVIFNYIIGIWLNSQKTQQGQRFLLGAGICINLLPLIFFKYSGFLISNINYLLAKISVLGTITVPETHLPLGISFFTFQSLSYLFDTYKNTTAAQKNPIHLGLYIALFPQLIAGPIVRYHDIAQQLISRKVTIYEFSNGVERFIIGLGKKVLIANTLGNVADNVFGLPADQISTTAAWIGAVAYTFQIYYDFSGYSDMAIGLGKMFGFTFLENFNYPYISKSIQEFWRRWHISLSNWFRDYLYIPLGGNRKGSRRTTINLFTVFFLCGFWHGASWNFIIWGLFHGLFLALERGRFGAGVQKLPIVIRHAYVIFLVIIGWVFFRTETLDQAWSYLGIMFGLATTSLLPYQLLLKLDALAILMFCLATIGMCPIFPYLSTRWNALQRSKLAETTNSLVKMSYLMAVLVISLASLATGAYNPFIYFRF